ncbi:class I SAM-dependent methyltransferase [Halobaculum marinum]|uniref:Methyltransferase domain-containing protein n=1 Tax=Halobaculum marinum TaxID=3031996 RepID=A0ABD5X0G0_9EURY|nr:class I SAM-dependent methyltransferase [Halobaculum sp. DT55]
MEGDDVAYLEAAATVDDRAHSAAGDAAFREALGVAGDADADATADDADSHSDAVRVLEAGAGTCGLLRRLLAAVTLPTGEWVAVDTDERSLRTGRDRLHDAARAAGYGVETEGSATSIRSPDGGRLRVRFRVADVRTVAAESTFDGVVARSFADLLAPGAVLDLLRTAAPDGWYHLPLTFDGETEFTPAHPADAAVVDAFHGTMRNRGRAATLLADRFTEAGAAPTVDARSDWVVEGDGTGGYPAAEATFLRTILDTVVASVRESGAVAEQLLTDWEATRRAQLARGELGYVAANRDLFGRVP